MLLTLTNGLLYKWYKVKQKTIWIYVCVNDFISCAFCESAQMIGLFCFNWENIEHKRRASFSC